MLACFYYTHQSGLHMYVLIIYSTSIHCYSSVAVAQCQPRPSHSVTAVQFAASLPSSFSFASSSVRIKGKS